MRIAIIGAEELGLATAVSLAQVGNEINCFDLCGYRESELRDSNTMLVPPVLCDDVLHEQVSGFIANGQVVITRDIERAMHEVDVVFLAPETPELATGERDLMEFWVGADLVANHIRDETILIIRSTVPKGTNAKLTKRLQRMAWKSLDVVSNPVLAKSNRRLDELIAPTQLSIGCRTLPTAESLEQIFAPFATKLVVTSPEQAEAQSNQYDSPYASKQIQKSLMAHIDSEFGHDLSGQTFGVWGRSLGCITESEMVRDHRGLVDWLLDRGARVLLHDTAIHERRADDTSQLCVASSAMEAISRADALVVLKEERQYAEADLGSLKWHLRGRLVLDGVGCLDTEQLELSGFQVIDASKPSATNVARNVRERLNAELSTEAATALCSKYAASA